jgi:hypothetical protein
MFLYCLASPTNKKEMVYNFVKKESLNVISYLSSGRGVMLNKVLDLSGRYADLAKITAKTCLRRSEVTEVSSEKKGLVPPRTLR